MKKDSSFQATGNSKGVASRTVRAATSSTRNTATVARSRCSSLTTWLVPDDMACLLRLARDDGLAFRQCLVQGLLDPRTVTHGKQCFPGFSPLRQQRMPGVGQFLIAGPAESPEYRPEEAIAGLFLDDQSRVPHQLGKLFPGEDIDVVGPLEVHRRGHGPLYRFAGNVGHAEQVECTWLADANQFREKVCGMIHVLHHL